MISRPSLDKSVPSAAKSAPPKIPRRGTNPHNKLLGMTRSELASGSGISTKQRLAQGALNPTMPKAVAPATGRSSLSQVKNPANSLMNLSFKKKPQSLTPSASSPQLPNVECKNSVDIQSPKERQDPTPTALNASRTSASMSPIITNADMPYAASPAHFTRSDHSPEPFLTNAAPYVTYVVSSRYRSSCDDNLG